MYDDLTDRKEYILSGMFISLHAYMSYSLNSLKEDYAGGSME